MAEILNTYLSMPRFFHYIFVSIALAFLMLFIVRNSDLISKESPTFGFIHSGIIFAISISWGCLGLRLLGFESFFGLKLLPHPMHEHIVVVLIGFGLAYLTERLFLKGFKNRMRYKYIACTRCNGKGFGKCEAHDGGDSDYAVGDVTHLWGCTDCGGEGRSQSHPAYGWNDKPLKYGTGRIIVDW